MDTHVLPHVLQTAFKYVCIMSQLFLGERQVPEIVLWQRFIE